MTFSSTAFFVFFAVVCAVMAATNTRLAGKLKLPVRRLRHCVLLAASYVFYGWWDLRFCFLMLALTLTAYISALRSGGNPGSKRRLPLIIGVAVPLAVLGLFKYFNFFAASFTAAFGIRDAASLRIILPVGISFYTFQSLSCTIDAQRGKIAPEKDFVRLALYTAFSRSSWRGRLCGPPISRRSLTRTGISAPAISWPAYRFSCSACSRRSCLRIIFRCLSMMFSGRPMPFHAVSLVLGVIAYSIQIYFDFSGYSDMAIGCAKCLGCDFVRYFNAPYISRNPSEFWRRWYISLSSWLKEYLYIPWGGSRKGAARTYINLMIAMLLGGLWHGADPLIYFQF